MGTTEKTNKRRAELWERRTTFQLQEHRHRTQRQLNSSSQTLFTSSNNLSSLSLHLVIVVDPYGNPAGIQTRHCNCCQSQQQVIYRPAYTPGTILCCIFFPICGWIMCCQSMAAEGHYCVRCGAKVM